MSESAIDLGDKLHIITRRRFEGDIRRHFVGEVIGISGELQSVRGYTFVFNTGTNDYKRERESRTRVLSVGHDGLIVNKLPPETVIESVEYRLQDKRLVVSDGKFALEIHEFGQSR